MALDNWTPSLFVVDDPSAVISMYERCRTVTDMIEAALRHRYPLMGRIHHRSLHLVTAGIFVMVHDNSYRYAADNQCSLWWQPDDISRFFMDGNWRQRLVHNNLLALPQEVQGYYLSPDGTYEKLSQKQQLEHVSWVLRINQYLQAEVPQEMIRRSIIRPPSRNTPLQQQLFTRRQSQQ